MSHDTAINLIHKLIDTKINLKTVYLDTVGPKEKYQLKLQRCFENEGLKFVVSEKADSLFKVVGAASICAKVTRDCEIKKILNE